jgi:hypothetical protein
LLSFHKALAVFLSSTDLATSSQHYPTSITMKSIIAILTLVCAASAATLGHIFERRTACNAQNSLTCNSEGAVGCEKNGGHPLRSTTGTVLLGVVRFLTWLSTDEMTIGK